MAKKILNRLSRSAINWRGAADLLALSLRLNLRAVLRTFSFGSGERVPLAVLHWECAT
ncbi:protein of unknown function [Methylocaldum szegediense]|uniref:Transposase n=1 Tax=Methylocaldum szegediense TaxID=73780 RepID=A0ABM9I9E8_9GAMM|nr:protein of unknown function [Methylocaldum szegediense]